MKEQEQTASRPLALLFSSKGRIGRGPFLIGFGIVVLLAAGLVAAMAKYPDPFSAGGLALLTIALPALMLWISSALLMKRLRDVGGPRWLVALGIVPFLWLAVTGGYIAEYWHIILPGVLRIGSRCCAAPERWRR